MHLRTTGTKLLSAADRLKNLPLYVSFVCDFGPLGFVEEVFAQVLKLSSQVAKRRLRLSGTPATTTKWLRRPGYTAAR